MTWGSSLTTNDVQQEINWLTHLEMFVSLWWPIRKLQKCNNFTGFRCQVTDQLQGEELVPTENQALFCM
jgi:hypothetical protein